MSDAKDRLDAIVDAYATLCALGAFTKGRERDLCFESMKRLEQAFPFLIDLRQEALATYGMTKTGAMQ